jgi:hypothetical protein
MANEHGNEDGPYDEVIDHSGGRRNREPDEDSEDRFDSQNNQQNSLSFGGGRPDATHQSGSDERSGSGQINQTGTGSDDRPNQDQDVSTQAAQHSELLLNRLSISFESPTPDQLSVGCLTEDATSYYSLSYDSDLQSTRRNDSINPGWWTDEAGNLRREHILSASTTVQAQNEQMSKRVQFTDIPLNLIELQKAQESAEQNSANFKTRAKDGISC